MREIDEIHLNRPFLGVRRVTDELCEKGHEVNHKRIRRLMQIMGIEAIYRYGRPEIFNSDQGSQFTGEAFTSVLKSHHIQISMDGRG